MTECERCGYFWKEDDERYPQCHYFSLGTWDPAPCEQDDYNEEPEDRPTDEDNEEHWNEYVEWLEEREAQK